MTHLPPEVKVLFIFLVQSRSKEQLNFTRMWVVIHKLCQVKKISLSIGICMKRVLPFFVLLVFILPFPSAFATVLEFNDDGTVNIYEAHDYLALTRHQKLNRKSVLLNFKGRSAKKFDELVNKSAIKYEVSPDLIHAVIKAESSYNPDALSPKGAGGLMQLMPDTATQYGVADRFSPAENIDGGTKYLKFLLSKYDGDISMAVAAYNAGEGAVDKYGDIPPYAETRAYVQKISLFLEKEN